MPNIVPFLNLGDLLSDSKTYSDMLLYFKRTNLLKDLSPIFLHGRNFIVAEPGFGKTRLLEEIEKKCIADKKIIFRLDLKKVETTIEEYISNSLKGSLANVNKIVVCLDALDEVGSERFAKIIDEIRLLNTRFDRITVCISCRFHFFEKYKSFFSDMDFRYFRILPFSKLQVRTYLEQNKISETEINKTFNLLDFGRNTLIQTPRYLELFVSYLQEHGAKEIEAITRSELLDYFIDATLRNTNPETVEIVKDFLCKLALVLEIYQNNVITKPEFMILLDELQSDVKMILFNQVKLDEFFNHGLLNDNHAHLEFHVHEFQEFLAAKQIMKFDRPEQVMFDLAIDPVLREIHPSWFNTLTFVIDLNISLLRPLLNFTLTRESTSLVDESYFKLFTKVEVKRLQRQEREEIFADALNYYLNSRNWIDFDIADNLSYYFTPESENSLKKISSKKYKDEELRFVSLGNVAILLAYILRNQKEQLQDERFWREKLIQFAVDKNRNGVLQRNALMALRYFDDPSVLRVVKTAWKSSDEHIRKGFLNLCIELEPNSKFTFEYVKEAMKGKILDAWEGLFAMKEKAAVKRLLSAFADDKDLLDTFIDKERIFENRDHTIFENINAVYDKDIKRLLENILSASFEQYQLHQSEFIKGIVELLNQREQDYILGFLELLKQTKRPEMFFMDQANLVAMLLDNKKVRKFQKNIEEVFTDKFYLARAFHWMKNQDKNDLFQAAREIWKQEFEQFEKATKPSTSSRAQKEPDPYEEFLLKLNIGDNMFMTDVFRFFHENKEKILPKLTAKDQKRLEHLIRDVVFKKFDPGTQKVTINKREGGHTNYTTHSWIWIFGDCLQVAEILNMNVKEYKEKIMNYVPFAYHYHLTAIFNLIKDIRPSDVKSLLEVYRKKRGGDKWHFMPESFIQTVRTYGLSAAAPILRAFLGQENFSIYNRVSALEALCEIGDSREELQKAFVRHKDSDDDSRQIAEKANEMLITKYLDTQAIKWRMHEVAKNAFSYERQTSGTFSGTNEIYEKKFADPLMKLKTPEFIADFFDLLDESFKIYNRGREFIAYAEYMWNIVVAYLRNLKENRSYKPITEFEKHLSKLKSKNGANWFSYKVRELKREYLIYIGKPKTFAECVRKFNATKGRNYLEITDNHSLFEKLKSIINDDLRRWVEAQGAYAFLSLQPELKRTKGKGKFIEETKQGLEDLIQKTIKTQFENTLYANGFSKFDIVREPQLLDGKRVDFKISYGLVGSVLIEVKLATHSDLKGSQKKLMQSKSYKSLRQYMAGYSHAPFGIFLVFDNTLRKQQPKHKHHNLIKAAYQTLEKVEVQILNCSSAG